MMNWNTRGETFKMLDLPPRKPTEIIKEVLSICFGAVEAGSCQLSAYKVMTSSRVYSLHEIIYTQKKRVAEEVPAFYRKDREDLSLDPQGR